MVERLGDERPQGRLVTIVRPRRHPAPGTPHGNHLRLGIALGLEQHRIHLSRRGSTRRHGLDRLGAANFRAIRAHGGIVGHVLRFERCDPQATPAEDAA